MIRFNLDATMARYISAQTEQGKARSRIAVRAVGRAGKRKLNPPQSPAGWRVARCSTRPTKAEVALVSDDDGEQWRELWRIE